MALPLFTMRPHPLPILFPPSSHPPSRPAADGAQPGSPGSCGPHWLTTAARMALIPIRLRLSGGALEPQPSHSKNHVGSCGELEWTIHLPAVQGAQEQPGGFALSPQSCPCSSYYGGLWLQASPLGQSQVRIRASQAAVGGLGPSACPGQGAQGAGTWAGGCFGRP